MDSCTPTFSGTKLVQEIEREVKQVKLVYACIYTYIYIYMYIIYMCVYKSMYIIIICMYICIYTLLTSLYLLDSLHLPYPPHPFTSPSLLTSLILVTFFCSLSYYIAPSCKFTLITHFIRYLPSFILFTSLNSCIFYLLYLSVFILIFIVWFLRKSQEIIRQVQELDSEEDRVRGIPGLVEARSSRCGLEDRKSSDICEGVVH
jgi:hypothetical protein